MALISRWYLCRTYGVSNIPGNSGRRGNTSRIFKFITPPAEGGFWFGRSVLLPVHLELTALTVDDAIIERSTLTAMNLALQEAPDDEVFDVRVGLETAASSWEQRALLQTKLEERLIDTSAMTLQMTVRDILRLIAKMILVRQALGSNVHAVPLDAQFDTVVPVARDAFRDHLMEQGYSPAAVAQLSDTTTFRTIYQQLLASPRPHWNLGAVDDGTWHLGHPNANLGDS